MIRETQWNYQGSRANNSDEMSSFGLAQSSKKRKQILRTEQHPMKLVDMQRKKKK